MNTDMTRILMLAAVSLFPVEIFLGVEHIGVDRRFDRILTGATYGTFIFLIFTMLMIACGYV